MDKGNAKHKSVWHILWKIPKTILFVIFAAVLLIMGIFMGIYSQWFQDALRGHLVEMLNKNPDMHVQIGDFRLRFPLNVDIKDVLLVSHGDTLVQADRLNAEVKLLPLLGGNVRVEDASLEKARYQLGAPDSASCLVIKGAFVKLGPSDVKLSPLDIHVSSVSLVKPDVNMFINPADTFPATPPSEPPPLKIQVDKVNFKDLRYSMQLMPTIYNLEASIASGNIDSISVDVMKQTVDIGDFNGERLNAVYLLPDAAQIEATTVIVSDKEVVPSQPWTVRIHKMDMADSQALYTTYGYTPLPGLDFAYIQVNDINLSVNDFYNRASEIRLPFAVSGTERCGITLDADGELGIDSLGISFNNFGILTTSGTELHADGYMGTVTPLTDSSTPLRLDADGTISVSDLETMFPAFKHYLAGMRKGTEIVADIDVSGTAGNLNIKKIDIKADRHIKLSAHGMLHNVFEERGLAGKVVFKTIVSDISHWTNDLLAGTGIIIPSLSASGAVNFSEGNYSGDVKCLTQNGSLTLNGFFKGRGNRYSVDMNATEFPVNAFMPSLGIGNVSALVKGEGKGFDFFNPSTTANVDLYLSSIEYLKKTYGDIKLSASVGNDQAKVVLDSFNSGLDLHLDADGRIVDNRYDWVIALQSSDFNLADLGLSQTPATVSADLHLKADIQPGFKNIDAILDINSAEYATSESNLAIDDAKLILSTTESYTNLTAQNRDLYAFYSSPIPLDSIMGRVDMVSAVITRQIETRKIDIPELQHSVMPFSLDIEGGNNNAVADMLAESNIRFKRISVLAGNDSSLYLDAKVFEFSYNDIKLDTVSFDLRQVGSQLDYTASVNNLPGTFDQWAHVNVNGFFKDGELGVAIRQQDIKNKVGFEIGADLTLNSDSTMTLHFQPYNPIINYQKWSLNLENFITYDLAHKHLDANLRMKSDVSQIALYTEHANDTIRAKHGADEDLVLQLYDIHLQDWIALDPFAPPLKGDLSAGIRVNWEDNMLNGSGTVDLTDLTYGKEKVGDLNLDITLFTDIAGRIKTDAELWINNSKAVVLSGALNDTVPSSPFNIDMKMLHLPLSVANPFLPGIAKLDGSLNGEMDIKGSSDNPKLNGFLAFEDAKVDVVMLGSAFTMTKDSIPVNNNLLTFNNFSILGSNANPLRINGTVDLSSITDPKISLDLDADNMQIVNTNRAPKGADIYGKAFVGLNGKVKGNLDVLNVNADVNILPGTNISYILAGGASSIENQSAGNMVKFVNFADTAAVAAADSLKIEGTILNLTANLNIHNGTIINVDLGTSVQDRVQIQGSGNLTYVSSPVGAGRLTGRYTFTGGYLRYAPPLISNLNFAFTEGSYVAFTGELLNPQFNIKAVEKMRANVSQTGQNSRLIYFDIILNVSGSLDSPKISLGLETDDDVTVANELATMSPTQRESEAMNLLLYNTYTGGSTKATSNLNGNPLFSFLTNSVNSWLANNVRGVDLSIGVNQYDQTTNGSTSTTTSYSYQVSKSLFNDRFKIVVGGSYSDDPNDDNNLAESLINDISFEYYLNNARTMYLRLFRHTGYESILEGEITQTGIGFVYKKRISRLSDMFLPARSRKKQQSTLETTETNTSTEEQPTGETDKQVENTQHNDETQHK